ncbi:MAG: VWA domain-containing protein, partial [Pseudomonadota bacterium]
LLYKGGANEHWNMEPGQDWLTRAREQWPDHLWINPVPERHWQYTQTIQMIRQLFENRMVPMTLEGISRGMKLLS